MANIFKRTNANEQGLTYKDGLSPKAVNFDPSLTKTSKITLNNDQKIEASCLVCSEAFCINSTVDQDVFEPLKTSQKETLCPVDAIKINKGSISIEEHCISCGLCIVSCPLGALSFDENYNVFVSTSREKLIEIEKKVETSQFSIEYSTDFNVENEILLRKVVSKVNSSQSKTSTVNDLVAKSLSKKNIPTYLTRLGDVNLRMDAISKTGETFYIMEIEVLANLDSPRDILDDVAVFCSRHKIQKSQVVGVIVLAELPNKRTEYWELISDIEKVTGLKIATIPIAALLTLLWNRAKLKIDDYYLNHLNTSAREAVETALGRKINLPDNCNLIEAAK